MLRLNNILSILFIFVVISITSAHKKSYEGYELLEVLTDTQRDRDVINYLYESDAQLDFWLRTREVAHILVAPQRLIDIKQLFDEKQLQYRVINDHLQRNIEKEELRLRAKKATTKAFDVNDFNTFDDIVSELNALVTRCELEFGVHCQLNTIGQTEEGRELYVFRIHKNSGTNRKAIWIDATTHAREWLSTATHLKIITHLVDHYLTDPEVQQLVDTYDWHLMPVVNPDGYVYSWDSERYWRKNRLPTYNETCAGVDLNRNFDQEWGNSGSTDDICSNVYRGASPGSERETHAIQTEAVAIGHTLLMSMHIHTAGKYWLIPWGSVEADGETCKMADDDAEMMAVANPSADAVQATFNTTWKRGNSCATIYPASGLTMDYFKDLGGVKYTVTPELRGDDFVVEPTEIQPSFEEIWNGLTTMISLIPQSNDE